MNALPSAGMPTVAERDQRVIDRISWLEHCAWVRSKCDTTATAVAVFNSFRRSASAERGRLHAEWVRSTHDFPLEAASDREADRG